MKALEASRLPALTPRTLARGLKGARPGGKEPNQARSGASGARPRGIRALVAEIVKLRAAAKRK